MAKLNMYNQPAGGTSVELVVTSARFAPVASRINRNTVVLELEHVDEKYGKRPHPFTYEVPNLEELSIETGISDVRNPEPLEGRHVTATIEVYIQDRSGIMVRWVAVKDVRFH